MSELQAGSPRSQRQRRPAERPTSLPRLDIVTVNWNAGDYLRECLEAVARSSRDHFELGKVIVVDNGSTDGSLEGLEPLDLPLIVIRNADNHGFGAACNQGAREGDGDLVLFLNPDTRVYPDTLDDTVEFMTDPRNARAGICGGRVINDEGEEEFSCCRFPTLWMWAAKMVGLPVLFPGWIPTQRFESDELEESGFVDQVIGAYFMIHRPLYESLGGFDERFFVYLEDVDLAYRAAQAGRPCYFLRDVPVLHTGRVSSSQVLGKRLFYLLRGRTEFARKHWPSWQAGVLATMILFIEFPVRLFVAVKDRSRAEVDAVWQALRAYTRYLSSGNPRGL